jgi:hypothetical protein
MPAGGDPGMVSGIGHLGIETEKHDMQRRQATKLFAFGLLSVLGIQPARAGRRHTPRGPFTGTDSGQLRGGETRPTLDPAAFGGKSGEAYRAAREIPDVLDHLYCYCECEVSHGHKSLKTCYVDLHAAYCGICQDEAILARNLHHKGLSILEIRKAVDKAYFKS